MKLGTLSRNFPNASHYLGAILKIATISRTHVCGCRLSLNKQSFHQRCGNRYLDRIDRYLDGRAAMGLQDPLTQARFLLLDRSGRTRRGRLLSAPYARMESQLRQHSLSTYTKRSMYV
jgi:hypothetical protein